MGSGFTYRCSLFVPFRVRGPSFQINLLSVFISFAMSSDETKGDSKMAATAAGGSRSPNDLLAAFLAAGYWSFNGTSDLISGIKLPEFAGSKAFTFAALVRFTDFRNAYSAILALVPPENPRGDHRMILQGMGTQQDFELIHFQLAHPRMIKASPGKWTFIAASYDQETGDAMLLVDGKFESKKAVTFDPVEDLRAVLGQRAQLEGFRQLLEGRHCVRLRCQLLLRRQGEIVRSVQFIF